MLSKLKNNKVKIIVIAVIVLVIVAAGTVIFLQQRELNDLRSPDAVAEKVDKEAKELKDRVSKLMQLPNETPTVATVKDADALSAQEFFNGTQAGDKVLIFPEAKKAVIYRENDNLIINSGPIVISSNTNGVENATE